MTRPTAVGPAPLDDARYPAYTMGTAATILGVQPDFLRGLGDAGLLRPVRSSGGHRRYSRHDLHLAARARELVDAGLTLSAACRVVSLEQRLATAQTELDGARSDLATAQTELAGTQAELAGTQTELAGAHAELAGAQSELAEARAELAETRTELADARSELSRGSGQRTDPQS